MPDLRHFPEHVIGLARALLQGELCEFALADALEEIGCPNLAGHFRGVEPPPGSLWRHASGGSCITARAIVGADVDLRGMPLEYAEELCPKSA